MLPSPAASSHNASMRPAIQSANASCAPSRSLKDPELDPPVGSTAIDDFRIIVDASGPDSLALRAIAGDHSFPINRGSASLHQRSVTNCRSNCTHTRPSSVEYASHLPCPGRLAGRLALGALVLKRPRARTLVFCALFVCSRCVCNVNSRTWRDISSVKVSEQKILRHVNFRCQCLFAAVFGEVATHLHMQPMRHAPLAGYLT